ncbi:hypothetical protein BDB01DRAFT_839120 [Pilobolus umbonatus]|nr:hypothetical protein BDB01DRAFT_839120 [Pilobolus umbonatus]
MGFRVDKILILLSKQLSKDHYYSYLTVNKCWYSLFDKLIYNTIEPCSTYKLVLFLEALILYPKCMESGRYVKQLDMSYLLSASMFKIHSTKAIDFRDALAYCPNIVELKVNATKDIMEAILHPKMPILSQLRYLIFKNTSDYTPVYIMDCYYKYRSSLVYLNLDDWFHVWRQYRFSSLINFLAEFPNLEGLRIRLPFLSLERLTVLDTLTDQCPHLNYITYKASSLNLPYPNNRPLIECPFLTHLELHLTRLSIRDVHYIKDKFTQLRQLSLIICTSQCEKKQVVDLLMEINTLTKLDIFICGSENRDYAESFWNQSSESHPLTNKRNVHEYDEDLVHLSFIKPSTKHTHPKYPLPTQLSLSHYHITNTSTSMIPINHQSTLSFEKCIFSVEEQKIPIPIFRDIEQAYPKTQSLYLHYPVFINIQSTIQLPETGLTYFLFKKKSSSFPKWNIMIQREVNKTPVYSWHWCFESKKMVESSGEEEIMKLKRSFVKPVLLFVSSTIEQGVIEIVDDLEDHTRSPNEIFYIDELERSDFDYEYTFT